MLRKYDLEYFHMTDCNSNMGQYAALSNNQCDDCARTALAIILKYAKKGIIFSISKKDFFEVFGNNGIMPNPFTLGVWFALFDLRHWADNNDPSARINYVFEAGDLHQSDAHNLLSGIDEEPRRRARFRYEGHAFHPKRRSIPTQAADILAWHGAKHADRKARGIKRLRGDFVEIVSQLHVTDGHHERTWLERLVQVGRDNSLIPNLPNEDKDEIIRLSFLMNRQNSNRHVDRVIELVQRGA